MGEYNRLNKMLQEHKEAYQALREKPDITDEEMELMADYWQSKRLVPSFY